MRLVPDSAVGAVEMLEGVAGAGVVTLGVDGRAVGVAVTLGRGETVTLGRGETVTLGRGETVTLGKLEIALLTLPPHPATRHPTTRMAAERERHFVKRRMLVPPRCSWPAAGQGTR
jgi:hypothetical protein